MTKAPILSKRDEETIRKALGGAYGGTSLSVEGDDFVLYAWSDAPVGTEELARGKTFAELAASIRSPVEKGGEVHWLPPKVAKRGEEFQIKLPTGKVHTSRCVSVDHRPGGGVGMGEYPESWLANFTDGMVLRFDAWVQKGSSWAVVAEPFEKETTE